MTGNLTHEPVKVQTQPVEDPVAGDGGELACNKNASPKARVSVASGNGSQGQASLLKLRRLQSVFAKASQSQEGVAAMRA